MLKDIYTVRGELKDGTLTLIRNDKNRIPINLDELIKGFTWYYDNSSHSNDIQNEQQPTGDNTTPIKQYAIYVQKQGAGQITANKTVVNEGDDVRINVVVEDGYRVKSFTVNGERKELTNNIYYISNVNANITAIVVFEAIPEEPDPVRPDDPTPEPIYNTVTVQQTAGGTITVKQDSTTITGTRNIEQGLQLVITAQPNNGYNFVCIKINGDQITSLPYTYTVATNVTITAQFEKIVEPTPDDPQPSGEFPVAQAVDLDLPSGIKWASWNIGSTSPLDVGTDGATLFQWGDPTGQVRELSFSANPYYKAQTSGDNDSVNIAGTQWDIATVKWGSGWQIPTFEQFQELIANCNMSVSDYTDSAGKTYRAYKIWSKKDSSKFIYLPESGLRNSRGEYRQVSNGCYYWTATNNGAGSANYAIPIQGTVRQDYLNYVCLLAIRPIYITNTTTNPTSPTNSLTDEGRAAKAVDLGLTVKWATYNVGTTSEYQAGVYLPWGYISEPRSYRKQDLTLYKADEDTWLGADAMHLNGTTLPSEYDVVHYRWGGKWRMPTKSEWNEIVSSCDWVWQGSGYRVFKSGSTNINESIFLPVTGFKSTNSSGVTTTQNQTSCQYWSSDINGYYGAHEQEAMCFKGDDTTKGVFNSYREYGLCVRPVIKD